MKKLTGKEKILDACCGPKMFWYDKENPAVVFQDVRRINLTKETTCDGRSVTVDPDMLEDFRMMPYEDGQFKLVIFDPPHDMYAGERSFTGTKYGILNKDTYKVDLKMGFDECMRVLEPGGVLVFKWNEMRVSTKEIIEAFGANPLLGHKSGKASKTHWVLYMKGV